MYLVGDRIRIVGGPSFLRGCNGVVVNTNEQVITLSIHSDTLDVRYKVREYPPDWIEPETNSKCFRCEDLIMLTQGEWVTFTSDIVFPPSRYILGDVDFHVGILEVIEIDDDTKSLVETFDGEISDTVIYYLNTHQNYEKVTIDDLVQQRWDKYWSEPIPEFLYK